MTAAVDRKSAISLDDGDVSEDDYDKRSIYSLLYSLYRSMGTVRNEVGRPYEFTFNTWGYDWPRSWGASPTTEDDPQRFGKNAYTGLFARDAVQDYVRERDGRVHVIELGCGTGAGAHHVCQHVLPECTYEAIDMQEAAIRTAQRKFVPELENRLRATCADATRISIPRESADIVSVCETHVTEMAGEVTDEDRRFFRQVHTVLKPGGFMVWGNAIPDNTWQPCFDALEETGLELVEEHDVTEEAIAARDQDEARINAYVDACIERFRAFRIPVFGNMKRGEAEIALKNFSRHPGTRLYENMVDRTDTYRVALLRKKRTTNGAS
jgi:ubiquinone/menaquinone biosynthesis C-methylase UbiE